jgi:hypothetical protein
MRLSYCGVGYVHPRYDGKKRNIWGDQWNAGQFSAE